MLHNPLLSEGSPVSLCNVLPLSSLANYRLLLLTTSCTDLFLYQPCFHTTMTEEEEKQERRGRAETWGLDPHLRVRGGRGHHNTVGTQRFCTACLAHATTTEPPSAPTGSARNPDFPNCLPLLKLHEQMVIPVEWGDQGQSFVNCLSLRSAWGFRQISEVNCRASESLDKIKLHTHRDWERDRDDDDRW